MAHVTIHYDRYIPEGKFIEPYQIEIDALQREVQLKCDAIVNKIQNDIDERKKTIDSWLESVHWTHSVKENENGTYSIICTSDAPEEFKYQNSKFETKVSQPFSFVNDVLITHSASRYWHNDGVKNGTMIDAITQRHISLGKVPKEFHFKLK